MREAQPRRRKFCRSSFTFIEMLAAIAILEIVSLSVLTMFSFSRRTTGMIADSLIVTNLLQARVEEIKCQSFTKDVSAVNTFYSPYSGYLIDVMQIPGYLGNPYLKRVTVTCRWSSAIGGNRQDSIHFVVAQR